MPLLPTELPWIIRDFAIDEQVNYIKYKILSNLVVSWMITCSQMAREPTMLSSSGSPVIMGWAMLKDAFHPRHTRPNHVNEVNIGFVSLGVLVSI